MGEKIAGDGHDESDKKPLRITVRCAFVINNKRVPFLTKM